MATQWYHDANEIRTFQQALIDAEVLEDSEDMKAFLTHPQRYNNEYRAWEEAGYPQETDDTWDEFVQAIGSEDEEEEEEQ